MKCHVELICAKNKKRRKVDGVKVRNEVSQCSIGSPEAASSIGRALSLLRRSNCCQILGGQL